MTNIHIGNIKKYLETLTVSQLTKELERVSRQYRGAQITILTQEQYDNWQAQIDLIEEELAVRSRRSVLNEQTVLPSNGEWLSYAEAHSPERK